jgi:hypothetical protein
VRRGAKHRTAQAAAARRHAHKPAALSPSLCCLLVRWGMPTHLQRASVNSSAVHIVLVRRGANHRTARAVAPPRHAHEPAASCKQQCSIYYGGRRRTNYCTANAAAASCLQLHTQLHALQQLRGMPTHLQPTSARTRAQAGSCWNMKSRSIAEHLQQQAEYSQWCHHVSDTSAEPQWQKPMTEARHG